MAMNKTVKKPVVKKEEVSQAPVVKKGPKGPVRRDQKS